MIFANYIFIGRRLTQIYADNIIKNLRTSALICGLKNIQKPVRQRVILKTACFCIAVMLGLTTKKRANKRSRSNELENTYYRDVGDTIPDS
jgi:hypothetical protein